LGGQDERFRGNWLAGFAPVGGTGFVVIVQTPESEATRDASLFLQLAQLVGLAGMIGAAGGLVAVSSWYAPDAVRWWKKRRQERRLAAKQRLEEVSSAGEGSV
jgi:hypothetical protein